MDKTVLLAKRNLLMVIVPYNKDFIEGAKALGGLWSASEKAWYFRQEYYMAVEELLLNIFGTTNS